MEKVILQRFRAAIFLSAALPLGAFFLSDLAIEKNAVTQSLFAGGAPALGALPLFFLKVLTDKMRTVFMGVSAGMMLSTSVLSLFLPAAQMGAGGAFFAFLFAALFLGGSLMNALDRFTPHQHVENFKRAPNFMLVVAAIALHNIPEGLAVGVSAASALGDSITLSIALQNIPEGAIVATALFSAGLSKMRTVLLTAATGLIEPLGALLGGALASVELATPLALSFAAGAMLWVILHELLPAFLKKSPGQAGFWGGAGVMIFLLA